MPGSPNDIDRAAIEDAAQRTAEQAALRKVRRQLDQFEAGEARQRRVIRIIALAGVAAILCVVLVVWYMLSSNRDLLRGTPIEIPRSAAKKP